MYPCRSLEKIDFSGMPAKLLSINIKFSVFKGKRAGIAAQVLGMSFKCLGMMVSIQPWRPICQHYNPHLNNFFAMNKCMQASIRRGPTCGGDTEAHDSTSWNADLPKQGTTFDKSRSNALDESMFKMTPCWRSHDSNIFVKLTYCGKAKSQHVSMQVVREN